MPEYPNLAELRGELTVDDPDRRASAYQAVMEADVQPSDVLGQDPPEDALADAGVIPASSTRDRPDAAQNREEMLRVLKEIRDAVQASGGS